MRLICTVLLFIVGMLARGAFAQDPDSSNKDEMEIRATSAAYVKAYNEADAEALAAFWSPAAVYTNRLSGEQVVGRDAIADQFKAMLQTADRPKLEVSVSSVQFISPNVAVEHGVATFRSGDGQEEIDYSAIYVRRDGAWLLDRITDNPKPHVQTHYEHLKALEWMIGSWLDADDNAEIVTQCNWTKNKNFITRSFAVSIDDRIDMSGMQIIGWDPADKKIRSWTFDSAGGFAEGQWSKQDNRWYVRKKGTTASGQKASAVNIITLVDEDTFGLQSSHRTLDGELLPNIDEVIIVRQ